MKWADRPFAVSETCFSKYYMFSNKGSNLQSIKGVKIAVPDKNVNYIHIHRKEEPQ